MTPPRSRSLGRQGGHGRHDRRRRSGTQDSDEEYDKYDSAYEEGFRAGQGGRDQTRGRFSGSGGRGRGRRSKRQHNGPIHSLLAGLRK